ncbi:MAG: histone deacetylase family protein [Candidatus Flexifilum sp.]
MLKAFYSDIFVLPLPPEHRFPMAKYQLLYEAVREAGTAQVFPAAQATVDQLLLAHDRDYIERVLAGRLTPFEQRRIGFPWSPELARRSVTTVGATIQACRAALTDGIAVNLAGGTHHAYRDHGEGYCVFNDAAVAARVMQTEGRIRRAVILDCDVHQGNGTAAILAGDPTIFTFSIHGAKNFPFDKERSDLDIELPDGTTDERYLTLVEEGARRALAAAGADLAIYLAGADPYHRDRLGRMAVSREGLAQRDRLIFDLCRAAGVPVAVTMAGGYAREVTEIAAIHAETVRIAAEFAPGR